MLKHIQQILVIGWKEISSFSTLYSLLAWVEIALTTFFALVFADMAELSRSTVGFIGLLIFVSSSLLVTAFFGWLTETKHVEHEEYSDAFNKIPLIELRDEAVKRGWDFSEGSEQPMEFAFAIGQAGLEFEVPFWGRKQSSDTEAENRNNILEPIPASHWIQFTVEPVLLISSTDNFYVRTFEFPSLDVKGYLDLHVDCDHALQWLSDIAEPSRNLDLKKEQTGKSGEQAELIRQEVETLGDLTKNETEEDVDERIDLNRATIEQLQPLSGVGAKTAAAIAAYRNEYGPFRSVDDLSKVKGIGQKKLDLIRSALKVNE